MNVIFDLDGTLIDSSTRMYNLFCDLIPECKLSKKEYWDYKRDKVSHKELINMLYPNVNFEKFNEIWLSNIETDYYLNMDNNYRDTKAVLFDFKKNGHELFLLTARQSKKGLLKELSRLGILDFFNDILVTEGSRSKDEILLQYSQKDKRVLSKNNYFISDMGKDIQLGQKYGFYTIGIAHGFMSRERLMEYNPDMIIDELSELL